jgi:type II secretory pathway pseudopilin PulG
MKKGFTLIETLLYVVIIGMMLTAIIPFAGNIISAGARSTVQQEISSNARYISEKIKSEIRNCNGTITVAPTSLTLGSDTIALSGTDIQLNGVNLNSNDVTITNLHFSNFTTGDSKSKNIQFNFTVNSDFAQTRKEYQGSINVQGSAEVRSN